MKLFEIFGEIVIDSKQAIKDLANVDKEASGFSQKMEKLGAGVTSAGKGLTAGLTAPLAGIAVMGTKTIKDFEFVMSEVQAISGATGNELKALEDKALEMGKSTSKSASEAAEALKYMGLAGWDAETSIAAIEPVLRLSEAGALDLGRTSDLVTDSMSSLGVQVDDLNGYLDKVAKTASSSNTNIDALMEAFVVAGGTFKAFNTPLDEANALLGVMANRGIKGSEAGNGLNSIMANLTMEAGQAGKAMEQLGIDAYDSDGVFKGMAAVLNEVREKTEGLTDKQRDLYLGMIGGKSQTDVLKALLGGLGDEYEELREKVDDSNGALLEQAATMQDNVQGAIFGFESALEGVILSFKDLIAGPLKDIIDKGTEFLSWLSNADEGTKKMVLTIGAVAAAIGPVLLVLGKLMAIVGAVGGPITLLVVGLGLLVAKLLTTEGALEKVKEVAVAAFGGIKDALTGLKDGLVSFYQEGKERGSEWVASNSEQLNSIKEQFSALWEKLGELFSTISGLFGGMELDISGAIFNILEVIGGLTLGIAESFMFVINKLMDFTLIFVEGLITFYNNNKEWLGNVLSLITEIFGDMFELVKTIINQIKEFIKQFRDDEEGFWAKHGEAITEFFKNVWETIKIVVEMQLKGLQAVIKMFTALIQGDWEGVWTHIKEYFKSIWDAVVSIFDTWFPNFREQVSRSFTSIMDWFKNTWKSITDFITAPFKAAKNVIDGVVGGISKSIKGTIDSFNSLIGKKKEANDIPDPKPVDQGRPSKAGNMLRAAAAGAMSTFAGSYLVGEKGPEIVDLPQQSRVYNHRDTEKMLTPSNVSNSVVISKIADKIEVRSDKDIDDIVERTAKKVSDNLYNNSKRKNRNKGLPTT